MGYFILFLFSAGVGLAAQVIPSKYGWLYEIVAPCATVLVIIGGWRRVSLIRKLVLLTLALFVGWFTDWSLHALTRHPDSALALRAGLILFGIRAGVGLWLLIWLHFVWKDNNANTASNSVPTSSSGSFQRMTSFEAGAILGVIGGAVAGALFCKSHGMLAEVGGAVGGGVVGLFAGAFLVFPISFVCALAGILAKIYWEVLTGRRKLPSVRNSTKPHRQRVLLLIAVILVVFSCIMGGIYFTGSDVQRSRVLTLAMPAFGLSFIGLLILVATYRRYPAQKRDGKNE